MARAKKSSLDMDEPVMVQDEFVSEPVIEAEAPVAEKAEETPAVVEEKKEIKEIKETKAETLPKQQDKKVRHGVKICVL